jgi:hypothetical protein
LIHSKGYGRKEKKPENREKGMNTNAKVRLERTWLKEHIFRLASMLMMFQKTPQNIMTRKYGRIYILNKKEGHNVWPYG